MNFTVEKKNSDKKNQLQKILIFTKTLILCSPRTLSKCYTPLVKLEHKKQDMNPSKIFNTI